MSLGYLLWTLCKRSCNLSSNSSGLRSKYIFFILLHGQFFSSVKVTDDLQITGLPILKNKNLEFDLKMWRCLKNKLDTTFVTFHWV